MQEIYFENIQNPGKMQPEWLEELLSEYPWFAGGYLLKAHYLYHTKNSDLEGELPFIGLHLPERLKLRDVYQKEIEASPVVEEEKEPQESLPEQKPESERSFTGSITDEVSKLIIRSSDFVPNDIYDPLKDLPTEKDPDEMVTPEQKEKDEKQKIIDKFIKEQPSISRSSVASPFFDPDEMARRSNSENDELVTETLAQIYYQQGNIQKSIKIYEQLRLKFPKKSTYFAAQIKKIINENNQ